MPRIDAWEHPITREKYFDHVEYIEILKEDCKSRLNKTLVSMHKGRGFFNPVQLESISDLSSFFELILKNELNFLHTGISYSEDYNIYRHNKLILDFSPFDEMSISLNRYTQKWEAEQRFELKLSPHIPHGNFNYLNVYFMQLRDGVHRLSKMPLSLRYYDSGVMRMNVETNRFPIIDSLRILSCEEEANA